MSKILTIQEPFIIWLQSHLHPQADTFFRLLTDLGGMQVSIFIWGFFIWGISYSFGCRLVLLWLFSSYTALSLKTIVGSPRPFQASSAIISIITAKGSGFPSGHAMSAMITWGYLAIFSGKKLVILSAVLLIFLISLSRVYLGVHYPMDVIGSWVLGGLYLFIFIKIFPTIERFLSQKGVIGKVLIILGGAAIVWLVILLAAPPGTASLWLRSSFAFYLSFTFGWLIQNEFVKFDASGKWFQKILRCILGGLVLFCFFYFSRKGVLFYSSTGLWLTLGAPAVFKKLRL